MSVWQNVADSLLLRTTSLAVLRNRPDVFRRGLLTLVLISLIVGLASSGVGLATGVQDPYGQRAAEQARAGLRQALDQMRATMALPPEIERGVEEASETGFSIGLDVAALPRRIPQPAGIILEAVGRSVSAPFDRLAGWMVYTILVTIAAHVMGGKASVQQMLGLTAFYAVPHLLGIIPPLLGLIPTAGSALQLLTGGVLGAAATAWGVLIYVAGATVASGFDWARGILAVLAPVLVLMVVALVAGIGGLLMFLV